VTVTYRFDAMPRALRVAIPRLYDGPLFEGGPGKDGQAPGKDGEAPGQGGAAEEVAPVSETPEPEQIAALLKQGRKVTVLAVGPNPEAKGTWIVAGHISDKQTGESKPAAVRIDRDTTLLTPAAAPLPSAAAATIAEGSVIVVEGKRSKRGVIRAKRVVVRP
jgi:hypothetical protein